MLRCRGREVGGEERGRGKRESGEGFKERGFSSSI
jgi:hypothetical protein